MRILALPVAIAVLVTGSSLRGAGTLPTRVETVALSGQPAPGTEAGTTYGVMDLAATEINSAGQVSFFSRLAGRSVNNSNSRALFAGSPSTVSKVARDGDPAAGTPAGVVYRNVRFGDSVRLSDSGLPAFEAHLALAWGTRTAGCSSGRSGRPDYSFASDNRLPGCQPA